MPDRPAPLPRDSQTKIVATVGPACDGEDKLAELITRRRRCLSPEHGPRRSSPAGRPPGRDSPRRGQRRPHGRRAGRSGRPEDAAGRTARRTIALPVRAIASASSAAKPCRHATPPRHDRRRATCRSHDGHDARIDHDLRAADRRVATGRPRDAGRRHGQPRRGKGRQGFGRVPRRAIGPDPQPPGREPAGREAQRGRPERHRPRERRLGRPERHRLRRPELRPPRRKMCGN